MNINWYPGHMRKTKQSIKENMSLVDLVYELLDARIPYSSKNPIIDKLISNKPRLVILNKCDLSSDHGNKKWIRYYEKEKVPAVLVNSLDKKCIDDIINLSHELTREKRKKMQKKGFKNKPIRVMIVGIPNVGKSTLINSLSGRKGAKTGNKPGVTKGNQWIKLKGNLELLDTPGILWPKFEEKEVGLNLAFTGAIKDELLDIETLAFYFVEKIKTIYPQCLENRYKIRVHGKSSHDILLNIAEKRGCIQKGGLVDYVKVSNLIIDDFRKGRLGRITLELPKGGG